MESFVRCSCRFQFTNDTTNVPPASLSFSSARSNGICETWVNRRGWTGQEQGQGKGHAEISIRFRISEDLSYTYIKLRELASCLVYARALLEYVIVTCGCVILLTKCYRP